MNIEKLANGMFLATAGNATRTFWTREAALVWIGERALRYAA